MKNITILILISVFLSFIQEPIAQVTYESVFTDTNIKFNFPLEIQFPNDGTDRMFVVEQPGVIKVLPNVTATSAAEVDTFLDISSQVDYSSGQEKGLLGLAFHPDFSNNGYFYVFYTADVSGPNLAIVLSRFTVSAGDSNLADPNSELVIFQFVKNQNNGNHNGEKIAFGPDGYLYISIGDGGGGNDPQGNAQNINNVFGSFCRIDVDLNADNPVESNPDLPNGNYEIPSDNPFVGVTGLDEIYAYGLRNTWKFSFDNTTGRLWGGDVGQGAFEEINIIEKGNNYGWSRFEANSVANSNVTIDPSGPLTFPVFSYDRSQDDESITGGFVYRGSGITSTNPDIDSKYIFGDYVSGRVWALDYNPTGASTRTELFDLSGQFISSFGLDNDGEIYFSDYGVDVYIYKIVDGTTPAPGIAVNGVGGWQELDEDLINGEVRAIASSDNGNIYYGGSFNQAGTLTANNIVVWNENSGWSTLGTGSNGTINALKIAPNGYLYVAGSFTEIGGVPANNIAVWDGSSWSNLGVGAMGPVLALEIKSNGFVYAAGVFESIGGLSSRNIGYWNGSQWNILEDSTNSINGTNNEIRSLHFDNNEILYVGGNFDEAGGNTANRIATWDGTNWGTLGDGTSGFVQAITSTPTDIYIGGNFAIAGSSTVNRIAGWNISSSSWFTLENGLDNNVNALLHDGTYLYAAGSFNVAFDTSDNIIVDNIARWSTIDGWEAIGQNTQVGVDIKINAIQFSMENEGSEKVYVGGNFSRAGSIITDNAAVWLSDNIFPINYTYDTSWSPIDPSGISTEYDDIEIISGVASILDNTECNNLIINSGAELTVAKGYTVSAFNVVNNGILTLDSDSNEFSGLIPTFVSGSGIFNYNRYANQVGSGSSGGNDLITPPFSGQSWTDFLTANAIPLADNGETGPTTYAFGPFNNSSNPGIYENYTSATTATSLLSGKGYRAATDIGQTLSFKGNIQTGSVPVTISSPVGGSQWNLIGNPYPSYLSFKDFFDVAKDQLDRSLSAIYGYNDNTTTDPYANGIWTIWDLNNANYESDVYYIAPGQGFFVASQSTGGSFNFTPSMSRIGNTDDFIENSRMTNDNFALTKLFLNRDSSMFSTSIYFRDINTLGLDPGYDTGAFQGNAGGIFTHLVEDNTGMEMANQSLPYEDLNDVIVPLGIKADSGKQLTIGIDEFSTLPSNINVYLEDNIVNTLTLLNNEDYSITPLEPLHGTGRFFVHFSEASLFIENSEFNSLQIYATAIPKFLFIKGRLNDVTTADIYDLTGRLILSTKLLHSSLNKIDISTINTGIYIVKVESSGEIETKKVIIR